MSFAGRRRGNKVKKGVQFTVMVVGQFFFQSHALSTLSVHYVAAVHRVNNGFPRLVSCARYTGTSGTGRTTFVNTLCESEVLSHKVSDSPDTAHVEEGIKIKPVNVGTCRINLHHRHI